MAVKYYIRYFDIIGVEHRLDIYDDTYDDESIQVDGNVVLSYSDTDDSLECIRGQGLSVHLEANQELTFNDLWSEDEKTYKVEYYRDFELKFQGWLNPDGWFENWVDSDWIVTFDCVDGLGYLTDLSFVYDDGFNITGKKNYLEILYLALKRTGLNLDINVSIGIEYTDMDNTKCVLNQVYANTDRYIKDDGDTIMSCEEVIRDVLEPFGAVITSFNGQWYIYKPNELYNNSTISFIRFRYFTANGLVRFALDNIIDTSVIIGNDGVRDLFHCSANQSIRNVSSVGAYRINYKYGVVKSYIENTTLYSNDGITIEGFKILSDTNLEPLVAGESGVIFNNITSGEVSNLISDPILISSDEKINVYIEYSLLLRGLRGSHTFNYKILVSDKPITDNTADVYYLQDDLSWGDVGVTNTLQKVLISSTQTRNSNTLPIIDVSTPIYPDTLGSTAYFYVIIDTPFESPTATHQTKLTLLDIKPALSDENAIEGEFHTFQRTTKPSAKVEDVKEVSTGDNASDRYLGTIYQRDKETPTETWNRIGVEEEKPLLQIMGEETLRINAKPSRVFSGDVYGYFNYLSVISIDSIDGVFMPISYSYDTKNNIISGTFKQIYGDELDDIDYAKTYDYGNTVKPTIRG